MTQFVYSFGSARTDGGASMRNLLGGKGANLAEMCRLGLPVPPGATLSTELCTIFQQGGEAVVRAALGTQLDDALRAIEAQLGLRFGDPERPLLLSVRSGARVSMPGMMDTVLNLGLNDDTVRGLAKATQNERFAQDSYRRFLQMFGDVVLGVPGERFEAAIESLKQARGVQQDTQLNGEDLGRLVERFQAILREHGREFPQDPRQQLWAATLAVFRSWETDRARAYRALHEIPEDWGTAVNVQAMVFGNMGDDCATGVAFTRNPSTGEHRLYGEYLLNAQGEDVVAGVRTPQPLRADEGGADSLERRLPASFRHLVEIVGKLEAHYRDMLDLEFTIQNDRLWMLQARTGKRTGAAAVRIAVEMVGEKLIEESEALRRVQPDQLDQLLHPSLDPEQDIRVLAKGLPASPGAVSGRLAFDAEDAVARAAAGERVLLVRKETSPEDIRGMAAAVGILTQRGGMTSHAAVVARGMGKCCVAGCGALELDEKAQTLRVGGQSFGRSDLLTLDGSSGQVIAGQVRTIPPQLDDNFRQLMQWANRRRRLGVRANSDTPDDSVLARRFGAEGIGLCRTEHMFFGEDRIGAVREMIVSSGDEQRARALAKLLPFQVEDFRGIFRAMDGLPVTIRLLDPPLHEFLPHENGQIERLAQELGVSAQDVRRRVDALSEFNPMLGHRGCRLGISFPAIYRMQVEAIARAAIQVQREGGHPVPEIMIPLVGIAAELRRLEAMTREVFDAALSAEGAKLHYSVGTMIEVPRACLVASEIAKSADFFSFGTNDLTQMGFGFSRDDSGSFLPIYVESGILERDPFQSLDQPGIGGLVALACAGGRRTKPDLKLGVCGEHGGDPRSIEFFHRTGLDYVSCSPYRVPIAILAAAQAAMGDADR